MQEASVITVLLIAVFLLYLKWILVVAMYPFQVFHSLYNRNKNNSFFRILAIPDYLIERFILRYGGLRFSLYQISTIPSNHLRRLLYRGLGASIGKHAVLHFKTEIRSPEKLTIGRGSIIGDNAILDARSGLRIGNNVNLSSNVSIYTLQHDHRDPYFACPHNRRMEVVIGDRVWLGSNVIVLPGVTIGEGAVCCAGCVVTKDVEPYTVVAGIPAKAVSVRPRDLRYEFDGKSCRLY